MTLITLLELTTAAGDCIAAAHIEVGWESLEYLILHTKNTYTFSNLLKNERLIDTTDTFQMDYMVGLWKSGLLLCQSKEYISLITNGFQSETVENFVKSNVKRMQSVHSDISRTDPKFKLFLSELVVNYVSATTFAFDPTRSRTESISTLKPFLTWFKNNFPYYRGACQFCNESCNNIYYGCVHPNQEEIIGEASRTELFVCSTCNRTSRFPRYNDVTLVLNTRRGRCGEYSVLMMRLLQSLGYRARWTIDRADHVWTEVLLSGEWVHVDPCEAAVDEPLLYQSWGKKQTFIFAYEIDVDSTSADSLLEFVSSKEAEKRLAAEDVTFKYTTDTAGVVQRRLAEGVNQTYVDELLSEAAQQIRLFRS